MGHHLIIDGNAVYEIDEECMKKRREKMRETLTENRKRNGREFFGFVRKQEEDRENRK